MLQDKNENVMRVGRDTFDNKSQIIYNLNIEIPT